MSKSRTPLALGHQLAGLLHRSVIIGNCALHRLGVPKVSLNDPAERRAGNDAGSTRSARFFNIFGTSVLELEQHRCRRIGRTVTASALRQNQEGQCAALCDAGEACREADPGRPGGVVLFGFGFPHRERKIAHRCGVKARCGSALEKALEPRRHGNVDVGCEGERHIRVLLAKGSHKREAFLDIPEPRSAMTSYVQP